MATGFWKVREKRRFKSGTRKKLFNEIKDWFLRENFEVKTKSEELHPSRVKEIEGKSETRAWERWVNDFKQSVIPDEYTLKAKESGFATVLRKECVVHLDENNDGVTVDFKVYAQPQKKAAILGLTTLPIIAVAGGASAAKHKSEITDFVFEFWGFVNSIVVPVEDYGGISDSDIIGGIKCDKCSQDVERCSKFCPECGTPVEVKTISTCPECGSEVKKGSKFCSECGTKVK